MKPVVAALFLALTFTAQGDGNADERLSDRRTPDPGSNPALTTLYFSLSDLSTNDQREQMWALPNETKAALWTYNIRRYLRDHPELSPESKELLRTGIRLVTTPSWFDMAPTTFGYDSRSIALSDFKKRAISALSRETIIETFIRLGSEPVLSETVTAAGGTSAFALRAEMQSVCYCISNFECGSSSSYDCYPSWCEPIRHCGWFNLEVCNGTCKSNG